MLKQYFILDVIIGSILLIANGVGTLVFRRSSMQRIRLLYKVMLLILMPLSIVLLFGIVGGFVSSQTNITKIPKTKTRLKKAIPLVKPLFTATQCNVDKIQVLAGSYYSLRANQRAILTLSNKGPNPLSVNPVLFNLTGKRIDIPSIVIDGNSFQTFNIGDWIRGGDSSFTEGNLQIFYSGCKQVLGAHIKLLDSSNTTISDEQLVELTEEFAATQLEGVWWLPTQNSQIRVSLTNTTDLSISLNVTVEGIMPKQKEPATITLQPHETSIKDIKNDFIDKAGGTLLEAGGISIQHSGPKGALLAHIMIQEATIGYSSVVQLFNPQSAKSSSLHGAGLRLGKFGGEELTPVIVARNIGNSMTILSGRIPYTTYGGNRGEILIRQVTLPPGEFKILDLSDVIKRSRIGDIESAGVEFKYSTPPGNVIISTLSTSQRKKHVFHVPVLDPIAQQSSTGTYPWSIEGDSSTVIYIKNVTSRVQKFFLQLNFAGSEQVPEGGIYQPRPRTIEPGQTIAFDIRNLRDNQIPDDQGRLIPKDAKQGQVHWSVRGPENRVLIGRAEQVDASQGLNSTYSSQVCCPDTYVSSRMAPPSATGIINSTQQFTAYVKYQDCFGNLYENSVNGPFVSTNTSIATVNSTTGLATARSPGVTNIQVTTTDSIWTEDANGDCQLSSFTHTISATYTVKPAVTISGLNKVPLDSSGDSRVTKSIQLTATGNPSGGTFSWSKNSTKVTLSNTTSATVTVTSAVASDFRNDVTITVTYTVNNQSTTASQDITVVKPTSLTQTSSTPNPTGHTCDPSAPSNSCATSNFTGNGIYSSYLTTITYDVMDQFTPAQVITGFTLFISESYTPLQGSCTSGTSTFTGTGVGQSITDCFFFCAEPCRIGGSCSVTSTQTIQVNGFSVATKSVNWTCSGVTVQ
jgi:hypothetical protein